MKPAIIAAVALFSAVAGGAIVVVLGDSLRGDSTEIGDNASLASSVGEMASRLDEMRADIDELDSSTVDKVEYGMLGQRLSELNDHLEVVAALETIETREHVRHQGRLEGSVVPGADRGPAHAVDDHLGTGFRFRLQEDRVHVDGRFDPAGDGLQCLGAADFTATGSNGGIVGHVLRLERRDRQTAVGRGSAQASMSLPACSWVRKISGRSGSWRYFMSAAGDSVR